MDSNGRPTSLAEIKMLNKEMLVPEDVSGYLGCNAYSINCQAQNAPEKLGYPVTVTGSRVRIPKDGFVAWAEGRTVDAIIKAIEAALASKLIIS